MKHIIDIGPGFDGFGNGTSPAKYLTLGNEEKTGQQLEVGKVLDYGNVSHDLDPLKAQAEALLAMFSEGSDASVLFGHSYFPIVLQAAILIDSQEVAKYFEDKSFLLIEPYSTLDSLKDSKNITLENAGEMTRKEIAAAIKLQLENERSVNIGSDFDLEINTYNYLPFVTEDKDNISYQVTTMDAKDVKELYESVGLQYGKNFEVAFASDGDKSGLNFYQKVFSGEEFKILESMNHGLGTHPSLNGDRPEKAPFCDYYDTGIARLRSVAQFINDYAKQQLQQHAKQSAVNQSSLFSYRNAALAFASLTTLAAGAAVACSSYMDLGRQPSACNKLSF